MSEIQQPIDSERTLVRFADDLERIFQSAMRCLDEKIPFDEGLRDENLSVYIKSSETRILYFNESYRMVFASESLPTGRLSKAYLQDSVIPISLASDELILAGCTTAIFDHFGHDSEGKPVMLRTGKRSLRTMAHPSFAILGVTEVIELLPEEARRSAKSAELTAKWNLFSKLSDEDRSLSILLAQGLTPSEIAEQRSVSKRTIENHRTRILQDLRLDQQVDLIKLVVRLQEKGFADFGV
ncbi:LuxR C-terminal-related transcriptional regulator [Rubripirellula amarantea]|nr:LuxR C-terminal-related transcriptional regulator [Rubripirellula amarantea]